MSDINRHSPGTFCWFELATTDIAKSKSFYGGLFDWVAEDQPMGGGLMYTMFKLRGRDVAAGSPMMAEQLAAGVPPHWGVYAAVEDVEASVRLAASAGGKVIAPPFDVMEAGRMAILSDPAGAVFSLWQAGNHRGAGVVDEPGAMNWTELMTPDLESGKAFYGRLFGWTAEDTQMPGGTYVVFSNRGKPVAGMMKPPMPEIPPNWLLYFDVADCRAAAEKCRELGGKVEVEPKEIPGVGIFAVFSDPQRAFFSVLQPASRER